MNNFNDKNEPDPIAPPQSEPVVLTAAETSSGPLLLRPARLRWVLALILFLATCVSTFIVGGPIYAIAVMLILSAHELGHFFQARRHRVPASLPYFIPVPLRPFGTMGAFILMRPGVADRRALFDIAITGPLAGLLPAIFCSAVGLQLSQVIEPANYKNLQSFGEPLLFKALSYLTFGPLEEGQDVLLHPIAFAGRLGIFITALNLIPIGQLDGGHVLYALIRRKAHIVAIVLLGVAVGFVVLTGYRIWSLMILLLLLMGPLHPPTADDDIPLGWGRTMLGWCALFFVLVGFTPTPILFQR